MLLAVTNSVSIIVSEKSGAPAAEHTFHSYIILFIFYSLHIFAIFNKYANLTSLTILKKNYDMVR